MEHIDDISKYKEILRNNRDNLRNNFYNNYLSINAVKRFIELGRMYFVERPDGFVLLTDEETYYHMYLCIPYGSSIDVSELNKPTFIRNIHKGETDAPFSDELIKSGFLLKGKALEVTGDAKTVFDRTLASERFRDRIIKNGFKISFAGSDEMDKINELLFSSEYINFYHETYLTMEEQNEMAQKGGLLCIYDDKGVLCGACVTDIYNAKADGLGIVVKKEYQKYGLAMILNHERMKWLMDNNIESMSGWINENNIDSLSFHKSLKFRFTDRVADEWLYE